MRRHFISAIDVAEARSLHGLGWRRADGRTSGQATYPLQMEWLGEGEPRIAGVA